MRDRHGRTDEECDASLARHQQFGGDASPDTKTSVRSTVVLQRVLDVKEQLSCTGAFRDSLHNKLLEIRKALIAGWLGISDTLNQQGETMSATEVRKFSRHLPKVLTDRERLEVQFTRFAQPPHRQTIPPPDPHQVRTR